MKKMRKEELSTFSHRYKLWRESKQRHGASVREVESLAIKRLKFNLRLI
jgi:hypothetical protein